jgi:small-conductance mechanosensitive channel
MDIGETLSDLTHPAIILPLLAAGAVAGVIALGKLFELLARNRHPASEAESKLALIVRLCSAPLSVLLPLLILYAFVPWDRVGDSTDGFRVGLRIAIILSLVWLANRVFLVVEQVVVIQLGIHEADNLQARKVQTQLRVLRRVAIVVLFVLGIISMLLTIDGFREFGAGLLASAGVASLVLGLAAQRTLSNLFAGFQIGLTQPIRLDDVVVVEGEWGRIEEITLTYVVIAIWDQRRLVLPISYFLEKPFQNWTRNTAELLGTIYVYADYTLDVPALRAELERLASASAYYDGRVCKVHVTGCSERAMEVRALVSSRNSGDGWELRCEVREGLIRYLQQSHPETLPVVRARRLDDLAALAAD